MKTKVSKALLLCLLTAVCGCSNANPDTAEPTSDQAESKTEQTETKKEQEEKTEEANAAKEEEKKEIAKPKVKEKDEIDIAGQNAEPGNVFLEDYDQPILITQAGDYTLTGYGSQMVVVDANEGEVTLNLENADIECSDGPALYIKNADKVTIEPRKENSLKTAANNFSLLNSVIYTRAPLTFKGKGSLKVYTELEHAIRSKEDLIFDSGTYTIDAQDDGIHCSGNVLIHDGSFDIYANGEGIESKKSIRIDNGYFTIDSVYDCLHSNEDIEVSWGDLWLISQKKNAMDAQENLTIENAVNMMALSLASVPFECSDSQYQIKEGHILAISTRDIVLPENNEQPVLLIPYDGQVSEVEILSTVSSASTLWKLDYAVPCPGVLMLSDSMLKVGDEYEILVNGQSIGTVRLSDPVTATGDLQI